MAITKAKKEAVVGNLSTEFGKASTIAFVNFKGLTVAEANEMRKAMRAESVGYTVAKKTLLARALGTTKVAGEMPVLPGEIAVAYGADELAPARLVSTFVAKFPGHLAFAGGVFGGNYVDASGITAIANIPPLETLRAQFVYTINSPIQKLAIALSEIAKMKA